jgi:glutamate racemase
MIFRNGFFLFLRMALQKPIGFFDSGYGGLTVLKEVQKVMPEYDYVYLGDNARAPYGTRSFEVVYEYTWNGVQELFEKGCDLVVLACNTASAKALRKIQQEQLVHYPEKRVLGVIRPSAEKIGAFSSTNEIVVLGTEGTITSNTYIEEFARFSPQLKVHQYACPLWVPLIESKEYKTAAGIQFIKKDVVEIMEAFPNIDVLLLGCTHYPLLQDYISSLLPKGVKVISQGEIVAQSLQDYLKRHQWIDKKISKNHTSLYYTTEESSIFEDHASAIIGVTLKATHIKIKHHGTY